MNNYTLDTNCILAIEERQENSAYVRTLADAHASGLANVAVVAISASENPKTGTQDKDFNEFQKRLADLKLDHLEVLKPIGYWGITFHDWCIYPDTSMTELEREVHEILFPQTEYLWKNYCFAKNLDPNVIDRKWRNCKCDVQAVWAHLNGQRDIFVTSDSNFHKANKKAALISLGANKIEYPQSAASTI